MPTALSPQPRAIAFLVGTLALPATCAASIAIAGLAFEVYFATPASLQREVWWGAVLNRVAPAIGGGTVALLVSAILLRLRCYDSGWRGHWHRTWSWYIVSVLLVWYYLEWHTNPDYGFYGQLTEWPTVALLAAILTDRIVAFVESRRAAV